MPEKHELTAEEVGARIEAIDCQAGKIVSLAGFPKGSPLYSAQTRYGFFLGYVIGGITRTGKKPAYLKA